MHSTGQPFFCEIMMSFLGNTSSNSLYIVCGLVMELATCLQCGFSV